MDDFRSYYDALQKPSWTPEVSVIGTVWTILYPMIFVVLLVVISKATQKEVTWTFALPFILNIIFNFAFTPAQMILRNQGLAAICAGLLLITIVWCMVVAWSQIRWISFAYLPYGVWVAIATTLQTQIWWLNR
jgi:tryptophan-rich sensory protein